MNESVPNNVTHAGFLPAKHIFHPLKILLNERKTTMKINKQQHSDGKLHEVGGIY